MNDPGRLPQRRQAREPAPLAWLNGASPSAPAWFRAAIAAPHERHQLLVDGAEVEWLAWGERGRPGLLLLHGNGAHADWWRFVAPYLADTHRVVALSWSGMGNSGHRAQYSLDIYADEILAVAEASGLMDVAPFVGVAHSFGSFPLMQLACRAGNPLAHAVIIDAPFDNESNGRPAELNKPVQEHRVYASMADALGRYRWLPPQPTSKIYICDFIARHSLKPVAGGFSWKFDPAIQHDIPIEKSFRLLSGARCPVTLMWGEKSIIMSDEIIAGMVAQLPMPTRLIPIPEAHHHVMVDQPLALVTALRTLLA